MTAHHLGVPLELHLVDLAAREHRADEFLRINPNGKVPVLDDDGFVLWESYAIMQYLAERTPGQALYPTERRARADVNRWLFWCAAQLSIAVGTISREKISKQMVGGTGGPDLAQVARGEALFTDAAHVLDDHLAGRTWITQDRVTLADFAIAAPLMHATAAALPLGGHRRVEDWFARVQELDAWKLSAAAAPTSR